MRFSFSYFISLILFHFIVLYFFFIFFFFDFLPTKIWPTIENIEHRGYSPLVRWKYRSPKCRLKAIWFGEQSADCCCQRNCEIILWKLSKLSVLLIVSGFFFLIFFLLYSAFSLRRGSAGDWDICLSPFWHFGSAKNCVMAAKSKCGKLQNVKFIRRFGATREREM